VMLYKKLLDDLQSRSYTYQNFYNAYGIKNMKLSDKFVAQLDLLGIDQKVRSFDSVYAMMFEQLYAAPQVSEKLVLSYVDRYTGNEFATVNIEYNKADFEKILVDAMGYWLGSRAARPVEKEESWKCNFCRFYGKECKVWWSG
ncbi:MAG: hypothetical protein KGH52_04315, partial [Candidatus Micrarchaeota archaeon]|nr:hypothetical protein [Candidatus Micrarchaeota archaeon]